MLIIVLNLHINNNFNSTTKSTLKLLPVSFVYKNGKTNLVSDSL